MTQEHPLDGMLGDPRRDDCEGHVPLTCPHCNSDIEHNGTKGLIQCKRCHEWTDEQERLYATNQAGEVIILDDNTMKMIQVAVKYKNIKILEIMTKNNMAWTFRDQELEDELEFINYAKSIINKKNKS